MKKKKNGFTLIELITTIALLAIIGTVIAVNIVGVTRKQQEKEKARIESIIKSAAEAYFDLNSFKDGCIKIEVLKDNQLLKENDVKDYLNKYVKVSQGKYEIVEDSSCTSIIPVRKQFQVTYATNLDSSVVVNGMPTDNNTYVRDQMVDVSKARPTAPGYQFIGWSLSASSKETVNKVKMTKNGVILYAVWAKDQYTLTFDANGGDYTPGSIIRKYNDTIILNVKIPKKVGYTFSHWHLNNDSTKIYKNKDSIKMDNDKKLIATYNPNIYEIILDKQDGTNGTSIIYQMYETKICIDKDCNGKNIDNISRPGKTNYAFKGYYTEKNGQGTQYIDENGKLKFTNSTFIEDVTLYAYWQIKDITPPVLNVTKREVYNEETKKWEVQNNILSEKLIKEKQRFTISCNDSQSGCKEDNAIYCTHKGDNCLGDPKEDYIRYGSVKMYDNAGNYSNLTFEVRGKYIKPCTPFIWNDSDLKGATMTCDTEDQWIRTDRHCTINKTSSRFRFAWSYNDDYWGIQSDGYVGLSRSSSGFKPITSYNIAYGTHLDLGYSTYVVHGVMDEAGNKSANLYITIK